MVFSRSQPAILRGGVCLSLFFGAVLRRLREQHSAAGTPGVAWVPQVLPEAWRGPPEGLVQKLASNVLVFPNELSAAAALLPVPDTCGTDKPQKDYATNLVQELNHVFSVCFLK